jgi:NADPH:quinone reductase-like Zn-dependent oxidoreductase
LANALLLKVGGVGSIACQMAKNIFGAAKVITTVSTGKVGKVDKLLGNGVVDQSLPPAAHILIAIINFHLQSSIIKKVIHSQRFLLALLTS